MKVIEKTVSNTIGRWMWRHDWRGVCVVLPRVCVVLYWCMPGDRPAIRTIRHELCHVKQAEEFGFLKFWWHYLRGLWRFGYYLHPMELEAQEAEETRLKLVK